MEKKHKIVIIDYGMGNLNSVKNAFHFLGYESTITHDAKLIMNSDIIILPGVGAFGKAMENLKSMGLDQLLTDAVIVNKKPFLGICLGMQLIAESSEEKGRHTGLGWIPGRIKHLPSSTLRLPHIGWNPLIYSKNTPLYQHLPENSSVYFVHSYYYDGDENYVTAYADYGLRFPASISKDNIHAVQYHPEKSHRTGLTILKNFMESVC